MTPTTSLFSASRYRCHEITDSGDFMSCGHCGHPIMGERKIKTSMTGESVYVYCRCSRFTAEGDPRTRVPEGDLDRQMLDLFGLMKVQDPNVCSN